MTILESSLHFWANLYFLSEHDSHVLPRTDCLNVNG